MASHCEDRFLERIKKSLKAKGDNNKSLSDERYEEVVKRLLATEEKKVKTPSDRQLMKRFQLIEMDGKDGDIVSYRRKVLVKRGTNLLVVTLNRLYESIRLAHEACGHAGRIGTYFEVQHRFSNVTQEQVGTFVEMCKECREKRGRGRKAIVVKPEATVEMNNARCQVDLIDMQNQPDGEFNFIMMYRDHVTRTLRLRALKQNTAEEVAHQLVDIFCEMGAPYIFHSGSGVEFEKQVLKEVTRLWPDCRLVRGKSCNALSFGSIKRDSQDLRNKLACWTKDRHTTRWSEGLRFVQFVKNTSLRPRLDGVGSTSAHEELYGVRPRLGLQVSNLPDEILETLETEAELEAIYNVSNRGVMECDASSELTEVEENHV